MNLIACDQDCRHQKDGYCSLNHTAQLTAGNAVSGCGYYESGRDAKEKPVKNGSAQDGERL